jgi:archaemetzincin
MDRALKEILVIPVGGVESDVPRYISEGLMKTFPFRVRPGAEIPLPDEAYHATRSQYHSPGLLKYMEARCRRNADILLGVTEADLYVPRLNFVFGEADMYAGTAIISLARLRQEFYGREPDKNVLLERSLKEAVHELGHVLGLSHCDSTRCIMFFSNSLPDTDRKGPGFCQACKDLLGI